MVWLTRDEAEERLMYESHRWIVIRDDAPEEGLPSVPIGRSEYPTEPFDAGV